MPKDFCISCGALLSPRNYECRICGFDNSFSQYTDDTEIDDVFFDDISDNNVTEEEEF